MAKNSQSLPHRIPSLVPCREAGPKVQGKPNSSKLIFPASLYWIGLTHRAQGSPQDVVSTPTDKYRPAQYHPSCGAIGLFPSNKGRGELQGEETSFQRYALACLASRIQHPLPSAGRSILAEGSQPQAVLSLAPHSTHHNEDQCWKERSRNYGTDQRTILCSA